MRVDAQIDYIRELCMVAFAYCHPNSVKNQFFIDLFRIAFAKTVMRRNASLRTSFQLRSIGRIRTGKLGNAGLVGAAAAAGCCRRVFGNDKVAVWQRVVVGNCCICCRLHAVICVGTMLLEHANNLQFGKFEEMQGRCLVTGSLDARRAVATGRFRGGAADLLERSSEWRSRTGQSAR